MDSFRKFGQYYLYKYNDDSCIDLVSKIIRRYNLNAGNNDHSKLYIVDDNYLAEKLRTVLQLQGEIGLIVKFAMFSGLREDELVYIYTERKFVQILADVLVKNYMYLKNQMEHL